MHCSLTTALLQSAPALPPMHPSYPHGAGYGGAYGAPIASADSIYSHVAALQEQKRADAAAKEAAAAVEASRQADLKNNLLQQKMRMMQQMQRNKKQTMTAAPLAAAAAAAATGTADSAPRKPAVSATRRAG